MSKKIIPAGKIPVLISTWEELGKLENEKYKIELGDNGCNAYTRPKFDIEDDDWYQHNVYLSTHTFYGDKYMWSTAELRKKGFYVQLKNWDGETSYML